MRQRGALTPMRMIARTRPMPVSELRNRIVQIRRFGGPDGLEVVDAPLPMAGWGEVRVRMLASGLEYTDVLIRRHLYPQTMRLRPTYRQRRVGGCHPSGTHQGCSGNTGAQPCMLRPRCRTLRALWCSDPGFLRFYSCATLLEPMSLPGRIVGCKMRL